MKGKIFCAAMLLVSLTQQMSAQAGIVHRTFGSDPLGPLPSDLIGFGPVLTDKGILAESKSDPTQMAYVTGHFGEVGWGLGLVKDLGTAPCPAVPEAVVLARLRIAELTQGASLSGSFAQLILNDEDGTSLTSPSFAITGSFTDYSFPVSQFGPGEPGTDGGEFDSVQQLGFLILDPKSGVGDFQFHALLLSYAVPEPAVASLLFAGAPLLFRRKWA